MNRLAPYALLCTMALAVPRAEATPDCFAADQTPTALSGADVAHAGAIRLTDLFRLMPEWHTVSTDFYLWDVAPGIFSLPEWDGVQLMVDGQPLSITLLGDQYLNAYPLDVELIDSVTVYEGPVLCGGVFAPSGLIDVRTRREKPHVTVGAAGAIANETGDPGPYRFTPLETVNIDRSGPVGLAFIAVSDERIQSRVSAVTDEHHVTDRRLLPRVRRLYKDHPPARHFVRGNRVDLLLDDVRGTLSLAIDRSRFDHFRFAPTFGSEVPLATDWHRFGGAGSLRLSSAALAYVSGEYASFRLYPYRESPEIEVEWNERRAQAQAGVTVDLQRARLGIGFSTFHTRVRGEEPLWDPTLAGSAWHFLVHARPVKTFELSAMGRLAREEGRPVRSAIASAAWSPLRGHALRFSFSTVELPVHRTLDLFFWGERGFATPGVPGLAPRVDLPDETARRISLSAGWHWSAFGMADLSATATVAEFDRFPLPRYELTLIQEEDRFKNKLAFLHVGTALDPAVSGRQSRLAVEAVIRPVRSVRLQLYYARTASVASDARFAEAWDVVPSHRAFGSITFAPFDRTSIHARLSLEGASNWPRFRAVAAASDSLYTPQLPHLALLDVGVTKRFWYDHVLASLLLTNVLNREFRRHPGGAAEAITLIARLYIQI